MFRRSFLIGLLSAAVAGISPAQGRWKPEYAERTPEERAWYERQQTTQETRDRLNAQWYKFCCDHSDTVEAQYKKTGDKWQYRLEGTNDWLDIPQDIVQPDVMTPHSKAVLFVDATGHGFGPVCFFPGGAGT